MTRFNHVPVNLPELETTTIDRKRFYVTPEDNYYPSITTVLSIRKIISQNLGSVWKNVCTAGVKMIFPPAARLSTISQQ